MLRLCLAFSLFVMASQQGRAHEETAARQHASSESVRMVPVEPPSPIIEALRSRVHLEVKDVPLAEAIQSIADQIGVPIAIHQRSLEMEALTDEVAVSGTLRNISAASALQILLRDLGRHRSTDLTYQAGEGLIRVVSVRVAGPALSTRIYRLDIDVNLQNLLRVIQTTIGEQTWEWLGGPSTMRALPRTLIVMTTDPVHEEVAELLEALSAVARNEQRVENIFTGDRLDPENRRVRAVLDKPSGVTAGDYTLVDLVAELQDQTGVNVRLEIGQFEDLGIAAETEVTIPSDGMTVRHLLEQLTPYVVSYKVRWGVLFVTTEEGAEKDLAAAVFDVRDLVTGAGGSSLIDSPDPWSVKSLKEVIQDTLDRDIWSARGGQGTIAPIPELQCLVVQAPTATLGKVADLLDGLRSAGGPVGGAGRTASVPEGYALRTVHAGAEAEQLMAAVKRLVAPGSWDEPRVVLAMVGPVLVIQHREEVVARALRLISKTPRPHKE